MNTLKEYLITIMKINRNMRQRLDPDSEKTQGYCKAVEDFLELIEKWEAMNAKDNQTT